MSIRADVKWNGEHIDVQASWAARRALKVAAEHVLQVSNTRVPLEEGTLERSGTATAEGYTAAVSYGTPYAVYQHERMDLRHVNGRIAKYLEVSLNGERDTVAEILAAALRRALE